MAWRNYGKGYQKIRGSPLHNLIACGLAFTEVVPLKPRDLWTLLILCNFGESSQSTTRTRCMLLLDSLEMADAKRFEPEIRKFVQDIYKTQGRPETKDAIYRIPFLVPEVPQQRDGEACGSFVLYFINLFLQKAPEIFNMNGYPYFMNKNWFTLEGLVDFFEYSMR
ncbi:hypothetical protein L6164_010979 [Bauhinia variegata]|uniref:Uncharacterized protein n=1 Tax=Bauhinia variegata TaxID=167791 RepID=A0ACB9P529_BAUVA|nr:hypothetical protein L6164_010979 [Bauhinia variegata]